MRNERECWIEELLAKKGEVAPPVPVEGPDCPDVTNLMDVSLGQAPPEVVARVDAHCEQCLTGGTFLVRAPAGIGKTALVTEWIRRTKGDRAGFYFRYRDGRVGAAALWEQLGRRYGLPAAPVPDVHELTIRLEERLRQIARGNGQVLFFRLEPGAGNA